jgi:hypothetical protein
LSHPSRQVLVQGLADEVVTEAKLLVSWLQDARGHRLLQRSQQPSGWAASR